MAVKRIRAGQEIFSGFCRRLALAAFSTGNQYAIPVKRRLMTIYARMDLRRATSRGAEFRPLGFAGAPNAAGRNLPNAAPWTAAAGSKRILKIHITRNM